MTKTVVNFFWSSMTLSRAVKLCCYVEKVHIMYSRKKLAMTVFSLSMLGQALFNTMSASQIIWPVV